MKNMSHKILFSLFLFISTQCFSQSVKEQYNNAIQSENIQKNQGKNRFETNLKNAKIYYCTNNFQHHTYLIIIGSRIIYQGSHDDSGRFKGHKDEYYSLKSTINYFDRNSSIYKKSGEELSWTSKFLNKEDYKYTFDMPALTLYVNRLSSGSLEKHPCVPFNIDSSANMEPPPPPSPPGNQKQPTINRPTELEKTLLSPMKF
jgi:hypothetical protein